MMRLRSLEAPSTQTLQLQLHTPVAHCSWFRSLTRILNVRCADRTFAPLFRNHGTMPPIGGTSQRWVRALSSGSDDREGLLSATTRTGQMPVYGLGGGSHSLPPPGTPHVGGSQVRRARSLPAGRTQWGTGGGLPILDRRGGSQGRPPDLSTLTTGRRRPPATGSGLDAPQAPPGSGRPIQPPGRW